MEKGLGNVFTVLFTAIGELIGTLITALITPIMFIYFWAQPAGHSD